jgi:hypothetical protein
MQMPTCRFCDGSWNRKNKTQYSNKVEEVDGLLFHRPLDGRIELGKDCTMMSIRPPRLRPIHPSEIEIQDPKGMQCYINYLQYQIKVLKGLI